MGGLWLSAQSLEVETISSVITLLCGPLVHEAVEAFIITISQQQLSGAHCVQSTDHYGEHQSKEKALLLLKSIKFTGIVRSTHMKMCKKINERKNCSTTPKKQHKNQLKTIAIGS